MVSLKEVDKEIAEKWRPLLTKKTISLPFGRLIIFDSLLVHVATQPKYSGEAPYVSDHPDTYTMPLL
jgi:hypothetical protein